MDALVTFYAEAGKLPHVSVRITKLSKKGTPLNTDGLGFGPKIHSPVWAGDPNHDTGKSTAPEYKEFISFRMPWATAHAAAVATTEQFAHKAYVLVARDCVSFARIFAQKCKLNVPLRGTCFLPTSFVEYLKEHNPNYVDYQDGSKRHEPVYE
jgi:hypothetical protein